MGTPVTLALGAACNKTKIKVSCHLCPFSTAIDSKWQLMSFLYCSIFLLSFIIIQEFCNKIFAYAIIKQSLVQNNREWRHFPSPSSLIWMKRCQVTCLRLLVWKSLSTNILSLTFVTLLFGVQGRGTVQPRFCIVSQTRKCTRNFRQKQRVGKYKKKKKKNAIQYKEEHEKELSHPTCFSHTCESTKRNVIFCVNGA